MNGLADHSEGGSEAIRAVLRVFALKRGQIRAKTACGNSVEYEVNDTSRLSSEGLKSGLDKTIKAYLNG